MLTASPFDDIRQREFSRLDETGEVYLDYTGSAIPPRSLLTAHQRILEAGPYGNPHSAHLASRRSTALIEDARAAVLEFFGTDAATHVVVFTANATAAIKLVAESYAFSASCGLVLTADNHNSVNGIREFARRRCATTTYLPLDDELRLASGIEELPTAAFHDGGLFAFPAQSNFSGVEHPLSLVDDAHARGLDVLLDAASFVPTHALDLRSCTADFTVVSFYKMCGHPTGVGALIARRAALARLRRPWFAGGTVDFASVQHDRHGFRGGAERFEDGTPNFLGISAVPAGLEFLRSVGRDALTTRVRALTAGLLSSLTALRHSNGASLVGIYGPRGGDRRGGTIAFNVLDASGEVVPYEAVEVALSDLGVFVRGGCFCNPGAAESAFHFDAAATRRCLAELDAAFTIPRFAQCLGSGAVVGALRASIGLPTSHRDLSRAVAAIARVSDAEARQKITA